MGGDAEDHLILPDSPLLQHPYLRRPVGGPFEVFEVGDFFEGEGGVVEGVEEGVVESEVVEAILGVRDDALL